jgi:hypothetical protein
MRPTIPTTIRMTPIASRSRPSASVVTPQMRIAPAAIRTRLTGSVIIGGREGARSNAGRNPSALLDVPAGALDLRGDEEAEAGADHDGSLARVAEPDRRQRAPGDQVASARDRCRCKGSKGLLVPSAR